MNYSSNPKKRYELFLKATQLDVIIEKLDACLQQVTIAKAKYKAQQRQHENYVEAQKKAHEKLNQFKSMEPLKVRNCFIFLHSIFILIHSQSIKFIEIVYCHVFLKKKSDMFIELKILFIERNKSIQMRASMVICGQRRRIHTECKHRI